MFKWLPVKIWAKIKKLIIINDLIIMDFIKDAA